MIIQIAPVREYYLESAVAKHPLSQQDCNASEEPHFYSAQAYPLADKAAWTLLEFLPYPVIILTLDNIVSYVNPAFGSIFGWTLDDVKGEPLPCVPEGVLKEAEHITQELFDRQIIHGKATKRLTKDGRILDVVLDGALFYDEKGSPTGQILTFRDITHQKRIERSNRALARISEQLHSVKRLDDLLEFITQEVKSLLEVGGAMILLVDEEKQEFFFRVATLDDAESGKRMKEVRFPVNKGVAGHVYETGEVLVVPDTSKSPYFLKQVDEESGYQTRNMLDVPLEIQERRIGVLCAVNKNGDKFEQEDVELLTMIASTIALPIENARINEQLQRSYEEVKSLNRSKDRVIHHLSHELKTPLSVLTASLNLLRKRLTDSEEQGYQRIFDRAQRNLQRILDMQYEIEDILREKKYTTYHLLSILLDACVDELDVLVADELGEWSVMQRIRRRVEELFGPRESISRKIQLDRFVQRQIERLTSRFAHRTCQIIPHIESSSVIWIPPDVLAKVVEGVLRNAIENTPDGGRIEVMVRNAEKGPELEVKDYGIGITEENQRLIIEQYFPTYDVMRYSSRNPYDFNAGGKGFDLLRMRIFAERYNFCFQINSTRCRYIPREEDICPGDIEVCAFCQSQEDCLLSGGTTILLTFSQADSLE